MEDLKPFKDVPQRLTLQIKRSFTAARSFVQALAVGRDVIHRSAELKPDSDCHGALMRMRFCPHCQGLPKNVKPCNNLCLNVMKGCLSQQVGRGCLNMVKTHRYFFFYASLRVVRALYVHI